MTELMENALDEFRKSSKLFHKSINKTDRTVSGIYFTPKKVRDLLFKKLKDMNVSPTVILEPSFGSGEFILDARELYNESKIIGIEKNKQLYDSVKCINSTLICCDFMDWNGTADLIIGNPPYFVVPVAKNQKKEFSKKYAECLTGRPNIYIQFLYKCLKEHLEPNGILAFILPTSLYNCSYYQPMRNYIYKNTTICHLETLSKPGFYDTNQETMLIVLRNTKLNDDFVYKPALGNVYISPFYKELFTITKNTTTLAALGLGVKTGNIVWNDVKANLADNGTLLIYSSNISNNELIIGNLCGKLRKQYVTKITKPTISGPVILVERGYGNSLKFNSVLVNIQNFYAENHINVVYPKTPEASVNLSKVITSFKDERTFKFIKWFIGNGSVSASDLETIVPIFY